MSWGPLVEEKRRWSAQRAWNCCTGTDSVLNVSTPRACAAVYALSLNLPSITSSTCAPVAPHPHILLPVTSDGFRRHWRSVLYFLLAVESFLQCPSE